ncbi:F-box protein [Aspergillus mulundensis]|uniref:F-box domain-containing protein n=1 Tax=Aspergillus mulundensis TaxID=1810919 RepID=A0A3D8QR81_9EURO|nr:hypothetical protein DSM5745_09734 [Aspergillus mulundensis]RDW64323.1 hypothetical protein DSM5745_09734 [Aspergillus mulundensis]
MSMDTDCMDIDSINIPPPEIPGSGLNPPKLLSATKCPINRLSRETLYYIFRYLCDDVDSLCEAARVCHRWHSQAEPLIYHTITTAVYDQLPLPRRSFVISTLRDFLEDRKRAEDRASVRRMVVYYEAAQQRTPVSQTPSRGKNSARKPLSPVQNKNDAEFRDTVAHVFHMLQQWNPPIKIQLDFVISYTLARSDPLPLGLDGLNELDEPKLITFPTIKCCQCLTFDYKDEEDVFQPIWEATPFHIAQYCEGLTTLRVNTDAFRRQGHQASLPSRRDVFAKSLDGLPATLENLTVRAVGVSIPHVLDLFGPDEDPFSYRMLNLSMQLYTLELYNVTLALDFWCPLDDNHRVKRAPPIWPNLRRIISVDNCLVEGSGGLSNSAGYRPVFFSHLNKLLTSLGYAVKHMPQLDFMKYAISSVPKPIAQFVVVRKNDGTAKATLSCSCPIEHHWVAQESMVAAWGASLALAFQSSHVLGFPTRDVQVAYDPWPPRP